MKVNRYNTGTEISARVTTIGGDLKLVEQVLNTQSERLYMAAIMSDFSSKLLEIKTNSAFIEHSAVCAGHHIIFYHYNPIELQSESIIYQVYNIRNSSMITEFNDEQKEILHYMFTHIDAEDIDTYNIDNPTKEKVMKKN